MRFPKWVNQTGSTKEQRAGNRLRYIIGRLALEYSRDGTLKALCGKLGVSHSTVSLYITLGKFSENMAVAFEKAFGRDLAPREWLLEPLKIKADSK